MPRLGDLPSDIDFLKFYMKFYETELSKAALNPARWRYDDKDFDYIRKFISINPNAPSIETYTHGIPVKILDKPNDRFKYDCKTQHYEDNILHLHDLLSDTAAGRLAGPFKVPDHVDHVIIAPKIGLYYKVPLIITPRHCTVKMKTQQLKGRRVSNLTESGVNALYSYHEKAVPNMPTLRYIMALLNQATWLIDFDYRAAYRQLPYDCRSWGTIAYNYDNHIFIDLSGTFGLSIMALKQQQSALDILEGFKLHYENLFTPDNLELLDKSLRNEYMPFLTFTKTSVYIDDNLAVDHARDTSVIKQMKTVFLTEFKKMRYPTDLRPGPPKNATRHLGWFMNMELQALKLPADKQKTILDKIDRFVAGDLHVKKGTPKKTRFLYNAKEIASLAGSLVHWATIHPELKPNLTPVYRLMNYFPEINSFRRLKIHDNMWLLNSLKTIKLSVQLNEYVPFHTVAQAYGTPQATIRCYSDGAGKASPFNHQVYGIGGICTDQRLAWQCKRSIFEPFLKRFPDSRPTIDHISVEELLAQQLMKFTLHKVVGNFTRRICYECIGDNEATQNALTNNKSKREFASSLISISDILAVKMNSIFIHPIISSEAMQAAGADELSRIPMKTILGIKVIKINKPMFEDFTNFYLSGTPDVFIAMMDRACPNRFDHEWTTTTAYFASWARLSKTNKRRLKMFHELRSMAIEHNVLDLLPAVRLDPSDVCLAHLATKYAIENYYSPEYIRKRIWAHSPLVTTDIKQPDKFPLTKQVLKGITRMRKIVPPVGVVLGKDTLAYFNSSLRPDENYMDLLLYTFDLIATTVCARTGELAPDLTDSEQIRNIISLDQIKFGNVWFKDVPINRRKSFLIDVSSNPDKQVPYFQFWMNKTKQNTNVSRPFLCTCTAGTEKHPILLYLTKLLLARTTIGSSLLDSEPLFAIPIAKHSSTDYTPLAYSDIRTADLQRTSHLGYANHNFRSHLRRKGGASDLFDAGISKTKIKVIAHWSIGILDVYIQWDPKELAKAQLAGLKRAELRLLNNWQSKIFSVTTRSGVLYLRYIKHHLFLQQARDRRIDSRNNMTFFLQDT